MTQTDNQNYTDQQVFDLMQRYFKDSRFCAFRKCSICKATIGFRLHKNEPYLDSNCDCVSFFSNAKKVCWADLVFRFETIQKG